MGGGVQGFYGGFEDAAREARGELLREAENRRLVRLARPGRGLRERLAPVVRFAFRLREGVGSWVVGRRGVPVVGAPDFVYLTSEGSAAVEVHLSGGGCVVRRTDLLTGASTDAFVADGPLRR